MPRRMTTILLLSLLLMTLLVPVTAIAKGGADDDGDDDDRRGRGSDHDDDDRDARIEVNGDEVQVTFRSEAAGVRERARVSWDSVQARLELRHELDGGDEDTESRLRLTLLALAEYRDVNGNGRFDAGEPIVSAWALGTEAADARIPLGSTAVWSAPRVTPGDVGASGGWSVEVEASLGETGRLGLRFVPLSESPGPPLGVRAHLTIDGYPFQADDTALALFVETRQRSRAESAEPAAGDDDAEGTIDAAAGAPGAALVLNWSDSATVDGADRTVASTTLRSTERDDPRDDRTRTEQRVRLALSYPRGERIEHAPELFLATQGISASAFTVPPGGLGVLVGALAGLAFFAARMRTGGRGTTAKGRKPGSE